MSKRYSGKSFKDSSVSKKAKLSLKEKRRLKKEKSKKSSNYLLFLLYFLKVKFLGLLFIDSGVFIIFIFLIYS